MKRAPTKVLFSFDRYGHLWCANWLHNAEQAQTPREDLINELLDRYYSVSNLLYLFKDFEFIPRQPAKVLVL